MLSWLVLGRRRTCYACAGAAARSCRLCGSATCLDHAGRLRQSDLLVCLDCDRFLELIRVVEKLEQDGPFAEPESG